ncbi:hypothetical protein BGW39_005719 [Mortierella sp. 14UC]|nr:hypothetical protein BGW39_005719 [Mortierella sp. 14UC]
MYEASAVTESNDREIEVETKKPRGICARTGHLRALEYGEAGAAYGLSGLAGYHVQLTELDIVGTYQVEAFSAKLFVKCTEMETLHIYEPIFVADGRELDQLERLDQQRRNPVDRQTPRAEVLTPTHILYLDGGEGDSAQDKDDVEKGDDGGIPKDNTKALEWFLKAAHQGLIDAQFGVVAAYLEIHNSSDPEMTSTILEWCHKAADQNNAPAQSFMGIFYAAGLCISKDASRASEWYLKAVGRSSGFAECGLGRLYFDGLGVPKDESMAFGWFLKSAEQGDKYGQFQLAMRYEEGKGVPAKRKNAIEWYTKADQADHPEAKSALKRLEAK